MHGYSVQAEDHPLIAAALMTKAVDLKSFMLGLNDTSFNELVDFALEQKNAERVVDKVLRDSSEVQGVQDSSKTTMIQVITKIITNKITIMIIIRIIRITK